MSGGPVFAVGCPRSGTTMLRAMLNAHPELAVPPESHFITSMWKVRRRYGHPGPVDARRMADDIVATFRFREWGIGADAVYRQVQTLDRPRFASVIEAAFFAYAREHGKSRWGDKTPNYALDVALLAELYPAARFIHLVRDGRNVALSLRQAPWWPHSLVEVAQVWSHWTGEARAAGRRLGDDRYMEIHYEDLVAGPRDQLDRICSFLDLGYDQGMLSYPERTTGNGVPAYHRNSQRAPVAGLRDWSRDMSKQDLAVFEAIAGEQIKAMGYETAFDRPPATSRLRAGAAHVGKGISRDFRQARVRAVLALRRDLLPPPRRW